MRDRPTRVRIHECARGAFSVMSAVVLRVLAGSAIVPCASSINRGARVCWCSDPSYFVIISRAACYGARACGAFTCILASWRPQPQSHASAIINIIRTKTFCMTYTSASAFSDVSSHFGPPVRQRSSRSASLQEN